jgi:hypothetical protein
MKITCVRELRHIVANFSLRNESSPYLISSGSLTSQAIHILLLNHMIECDSIYGPFLWVKPNAKLLSK